MSARSETLEGIDSEERAWLASYLDVFARKYAHELAEKQRAFDGPSITMAGRTMVPLDMLTDLIDPKKEGQ